MIALGFWGAILVGWQVYALVVVPAFPAALNNFTEGEVIEEEDWNAIEQRIGENATTTRSTLTFQVNDLMASTTMSQITTLTGLTTTGALNAGSISSGFGAINVGSDNITTSGLGTFGTLLSNGSSTLQSFTFINATGTSATTTNSFATTASSTNMFSTNGNVGALTVGALTSGRVTFATTAGLLTDDSDLTFSTDTLSATKLLSSTSVSTPSLISTGAVTITPTGGSNLNVSLSTTGDFVVNTSQFYVDTSAAFIGIGTTTPAYKVDIFGDMRIDPAGRLITAYSAAPTVDTNGQIAIDSTSNQVKFQSGGATKVLGDGNQYPAFTYASSTVWTASTTIPLGPAFVAETWNSVKCFTDAGTLNVSFTDGTNRMNMFNASTTVGTVGLATNNTFTASEKRYVEIGTPASSPTKISCTVSKSITAD